MDIVPSIWLSSLAGAAFFYASGRIWPRHAGAMRDASAPAPAFEPASRAASELEGARAAIAYAEAEAAAAGEARAQATRALAEERARAQAIDQQLTAERAAWAEARREAEGEIRAASAQAARLAAEKEGLTREKAALAAEKARIAEEKARIGAQAAEVAAQLAELRAKGATDLGKTKALVFAAEARAAEAEKKAAGTVAALKVKLDETTREISRARVEAAVLARKDQEIADLARRVEVLSAATSEADELRRRVRELEAKTFAREAMESVPELPPSERWTEGEALETSLESALAEVVEHEGGCRTAVLSDARGLLIASAGADGACEEIAAAAALATMAAERLRDLLPVGQPVSMAVLDDNQVVFRTRWLRYGDECFLLSTLGVRTRPLEQGADTLRARLTALVFG